MQQKALLRAGVLREPCVGPPTAAGAGGSYAPCRGPGLDSGSAGPPKPGPSQKCASSSQGMQAQGRGAEAWGGPGFKRAGSSCRGRAMAPSAGGGHHQKFQRPRRQMGLFRAITGPAPLPATGDPLPSLPPASAGHPEASCRPSLTHAAPCHVPAGPHMPSGDARVRKAGGKAMFSLPDGMCVCCPRSKLSGHRAGI